MSTSRDSSSAWVVLARTAGWVGALAIAACGGGSTDASNGSDASVDSGTGTDGASGDAPSGDGGGTEASTDSGGGDGSGTEGGADTGTQDGGDDGGGIPCLDGGACPPKQACCALPAGIDYGKCYATACLACCQ